MDYTLNNVDETLVEECTETHNNIGEDDTLVYNVDDTEVVY